MKAILQRGRVLNYLWPGRSLYPKQLSFGAAFLIFKNQHLNKLGKTTQSLPFHTFESALDTTNCWQLQIGIRYFFN